MDSKLHWLSELVVLGAHPLGGVFKVVVPDVRFKPPLLLMEKLGCGSSLQTERDPYDQVSTKEEFSRGMQEDELLAVWTPLRAAPRWTEYATEDLADSNIKNYSSGKMFCQLV